MRAGHERAAQYRATDPGAIRVAGRTSNSTQFFFGHVNRVYRAFERAHMLKVSIDAPQRDRTALFLDVDGTLLDLAASPTAVVVPRGLVECIASIELALGGALALFSGLFQPLCLRASGVHGAEIRYDPLTPVVTVEAADALPSRLWRSLNELSRISPARSQRISASVSRSTIAPRQAAARTCARFCGSLSPPRGAPMWRSSTRASRSKSKAAGSTRVRRSIDF